MMVNLKDIYLKLGVGVCLIEDGKVTDRYLLADEDIELISEFSFLTTFLPENFKFGIFEHEKGRFAIIKHRNNLLGFPVREDNFMGLIKNVEVKLNDKILHP